MKKKLIILTLFLIFFLAYWLRFDIQFLFHSRNLIFWDKEATIEIQDYKMDPDPKSQHFISFWNGIALYSGVTGSKAFAIFDKSQSWTKDTLLYDYKEELKLQRLSFDLAEVYARKMNKKIQSLEYANFESRLPYKELAKHCYPIYKEFEKRNDEMLNYENKSLSEVLTHWRPKIDSMLVSME